MNFFMNKHRKKLIWGIDGLPELVCKDKRLFDSVDALIGGDKSLQGNMLLGKPVLNYDIILQTCDRPFILLANQDNTKARQFLRCHGYIEEVDFCEVSELFSAGETKRLESERQVRRTKKELLIAFIFDHGYGIGDTIIMRSAYDAILSLAPTAKVDFFCADSIGRECVEVFYGNSSNLNRIYKEREFNRLINEYAVVIRGARWLKIAKLDEFLLKLKTPKLLSALKKVQEFNKLYFREWNNVVLRNVTLSHILGLNDYTCLGGGALPIKTQHVALPLWEEAKPRFNQLNLGNYYCTITVGSGCIEGLRQVKEWPNEYLERYIGLLK